jgi:hypothetical protein
MSGAGGAAAGAGVLVALGVGFDLLAGDVDWIDFLFGEGCLSGEVRVAAYVREVSPCSDRGCFWGVGSGSLLVRVRD